jgi:AcrR family transcriptional regulator
MRTYTKNVRAAREEATRTRLLDAAERAFFAGPWERATLHAIAGDARVTKGTLLRHFSSKDGLLEAAFDRAYERVRTQRFAAEAGDVDAAIANLLDHYHAMGAQSLRLGALGDDGPGARIRDAAKGLHREWVEHAFGARLATSPSRSRVLAALVVVCDVRSWSILAHDLRLPRAEIHATLVLAVRRLLGEPA